MTADFSARIAALRAIPGVDAVALVPGTNLAYFTGLDFFLSERPVIVLVTPAWTFSCPSGRSLCWSHRTSLA